MMFAIFLEFWPLFFPLTVCHATYQYIFLRKIGNSSPPSAEVIYGCPQAQSNIPLQDSKAKKGTYLKQSAGGTVGLFTGISLMSGVEALYWIYKVGAIC